LRRLGFVQVVALCEGSQAQADERAQALNIPHAYGSVEALLAHPDLHVVHNCTPNHLHAEINRQILRAGKHVFSEKPLCMTPEEARELVALAEQAGAIHGVSFVYRQFAMVRQAASMVRDGSVGRLFATHGSYLQDWMFLETDYNWRVDAALGGASRAVADIGSHWCDTVQFVTGRHITEVMADLSIVWPTRKANVAGNQTFGHDAQAVYEDKAVTTEDFGSVLFRFDDGSKGCFSVSQVSAGRKNRLSFEINGSEQSVAWDQEVPQRLWMGQRAAANQLLSDDPGLMHPDAADSAHFPGGHIEGWPDAFKNMMAQFYRAVQAGKMPEQPLFATFHDGARVMHIIDVLVHHFLHRLQHGQRRNGLKDIAPHIHAGCPLIDGAEAHFQRLLFRQLFTPGDDDRHRAAGGHFFKAFGHVIGFDKLRPHFGGDAAGKREVTRIAGHLFTDAGHRQGGHAVARARVHQLDDVIDRLMLKLAADVHLRRHGADVQAQGIFHRHRHAFVGEFSQNRVAAGGAQHHRPIGRSRHLASQNAAGAHQRMMSPTLARMDKLPVPPPESVLSDLAL
jgi:predicted dehydrogenase